MAHADDASGDDQDVPSLVFGGELCPRRVQKYGNYRHRQHDLDVELEVRTGNGTTTTYYSPIQLLISASEVLAERLRVNPQKLEIYDQFPGMPESFLWFLQFTVPSPLRRKVDNVTACDLALFSLKFRCHFLHETVQRFFQLHIFAIRNDRLKQLFENMAAEEEYRATWLYRVLREHITNTFSIAAIKHFENLPEKIHMLLLINAYDVEKERKRVASEDLNNGPPRKLSNTAYKPGRNLVTATDFNQNEMKSNCCVSTTDDICVQ